MSTKAQQSLKPGQLLPELVAARGLAAIWIVLAHTLAKTLEGYGGLPAAMEYTRVIVDFFFVMSGFVLAHMYDAAWREGRFSYVNFLARRLVRLYPLHLATLLICLAIVLVGKVVGAAPENPHDISSFMANLFLVHSAWTTPDLAWNWPSWSVSAEWCAYLAIPLFLAVADRTRGTLARICVGLGSFVLIAAVSEVALRRDLIELTYDGGALRIVPSFLMGILLRRIFDDEPCLTAMTPRSYAAALAGVAAVCGGLIVTGASYDALWPPMVVLVAALASRGTWTAPGLLRGRTFAWLGELSYAIYMTHAIVIQVVFVVGERLGVAQALDERAVLGIAVVALTIGGSQIAYTLVERPGRGVMAKVLGLNRPAKAAVPALTP